MFLYAEACWENSSHLETAAVISAPLTGSLEGFVCTVAVEKPSELKTLDAFVSRAGLCISYDVDSESLYLVYVSAVFMLFLCCNFGVTRGLHECRAVCRTSVLASL